MTRTGAARFWVPAWVAVLVGGCGDPALTGPESSAEEPFELSQATSGQTTLVIEGVTGSIRLVGESGGQAVDIDGVFRTKAPFLSEAEDALANLDVEVLEDDSVITVRTLQPTDPGRIGYEVHYDIVLPDDFDVRVTSVTGDVEVRSLRGDVEITQVTGTVALEDVEGSLAVSLTTGSVAAEMSLPQGGAIDVSVVTGSIALSLPVSTSAILRASVVTGGISVSGLEAGDGDEDARPNVALYRLGDEEGTIDLGVVTGSIAVTGR